LASSRSSPSACSPRRSPVARRARSPRSRRPPPPGPLSESHWLPRPAAGPSALLVSTCFHIPDHHVPPDSIRRRRSGHERPAAPHCSLTHGGEPLRPCPASTRWILPGRRDQFRPPCPRSPERPNRSSDSSRSSLECHTCLHAHRPLLIPVPGSPTPRSTPAASARAGSGVPLPGDREHLQHDSLHVVLRRASVSPSELTLHAVAEPRCLRLDSVTVPVISSNSATNARNLDISSTNRSPAF